MPLMMDDDDAKDNDGGWNLHLFIFLFLHFSFINLFCFSPFYDFFTFLEFLI